MVRGHAKEQSQQANAKKQAALQKAGSQLEAQKAGVKMVCPSCKMGVASYKVLVQHFDSKHPKETCPTEESLKG